MPGESNTIVRPRTEAERQSAIYGWNWYTPAEAGEVAAGQSADKIIAAIDAGELKAMRVESPGSQRRQLKIREDWLEAWMESRIVNADAA
ncbi:MAG: hypothetical protein ACODAA_08875 [Gemmatimonadota bacterium]